MGPVSVLLEALKAEDPNKVYKWDYIKGEYGAFTEEQGGTVRKHVAVGVTPVSYGAGGMESWGQTCGTALAAATVAQMVGRRPLIDKVFSAYGQIPHPMNDVGNSTWLRDGVHKVYYGNPAVITDFTPTHVVPPSNLGSLQCHNALEKFMKAVKGITGYTRSDGCARLCADMAYVTMKVIDQAVNGTAGYPTPALSTARNSCATAGCHNGGSGATTVVGKENCVVCHK